MQSLCCRGKFRRGKIPPPLQTPKLTLPHTHSPLRQEIPEGENSATLANPKAYTASHTQPTATTPRFRSEKIALPSEKTKFPRKLSVSEIIPPLAATYLCFSQ